jgi:hypothetical protein
MMLEDLLSRGYILNDKLKHSEILPFVQTYLKKRTLAAYFYIAINLFLIALMTYHAVRSPIPFSNAVANFGLGIILSLILIPLHEAIHGIAYKLLGAGQVKYRANFRKFIFYAMADKFIVTSNQFRFVALAPFAVITSCVVIALFFASESASFYLLGVLLFHTAACSGDFGLMSYVDSQSKRMITYDDEQLGESYFLTVP